MDITLRFFHIRYGSEEYYREESFSCNFSMCSKMTVDYFRIVYPGKWNGSAAIACLGPPNVRWCTAVLFG